MTDRLKGFMVILSNDIREDDAQMLRDSMLMLRGVQDVRPIKAEISADHLTEIRTINRLEGRVRDIFHEERSR